MEGHDAGERSGREAGGAAVVAFSLLGNAYLVLATLVLGSLATVVGFLPPRGDWMFRVARVWSRGLLWSSGVRMQVSYEVDLDPRAGYVFLANHQSIFDIPVLILGVPGQARFLAKRSLFRIPVFGWSLHAGGFVPVDRADRAASRRTFTAASRRLAAGRSLVVFPEETRSTDGVLGSFKRGGPLLAMKTGFPIVPVGIEGTLEARPKGSLLNRPRTVRVRFGRPIPAAELAGKSAPVVTAEVRERVAALLGPV